MDLVVEYVIQFGALGLLGYLIVWLTLKGAPTLFACLRGIQETLEKNSARLASLERRQEDLLQTITRVLLSHESRPREHVVDPGDGVGGDRPA